MDPVIKNFDGRRNPILGPDDGVPNYVMLYVRHEPGGSSAHHTHAWEHQAFITEGEGILWCDGKEYPIKQGDAVLVPPNSGAPLHQHRYRNAQSRDGKSAQPGRRRIALTRTTDTFCRKKSK